jgi:hypothetical protein
LALKGLGTVFNECAERGPALLDWPLDTVKTSPGKSRVQVRAPVSNLEEAWRLLLGRPFRGLNPESYKSLEDHKQGQALGESLKKADDDQQYLYDFSFSDFNRRTRNTNSADFGVLVAVSPEEILLRDKESYFRRFVEEHQKKEAGCALIVITDKSEKDIQKTIRKTPGFDPDGRDVLLILSMESKNGPLAINQLLTVKLILNALSTAIMARSGRIAGNTLTVFDPTDPRSIDRATSQLQSHVNDALKRPGWVKRHGILKPISYGEANAVLFDTVRFLQRNREAPPRSLDMALCIVRILESLRLKKGVSPKKALLIIQNRGLQQYLTDVTTQSQ